MPILASTFASCFDRKAERTSAIYWQHGRARCYAFTLRATTTLLLIQTQVRPCNGLQLQLDQDTLNCECNAPHGDTHMAIAAVRRGVCMLCGQGVWTDQPRGRDVDGDYTHKDCSELADELACKDSARSFVSNSPVAEVQVQHRNGPRPAVDCSRVAAQSKSWPT